MSIETKTKKKTVPIDASLHRILKQRALDLDKAIGELIEDMLGEQVGWTREPQSELKLAGVQ